MNQRKIILILILLTTGGTLSSQNLPFSNQYYVNRNFLSPSYTGYNSNYETYISHQNGWIGFQGAPQFSSIYSSGPLYENFSLGGSIKRNVITIFNEFSANLDFAYHLKINEDHFLHFGLSYEFIENFLDTKSSSYSAVNDPYLWEHKNYFNSGLGLMYSYKDLQVGVTLPRIFDMRRSNLSNDSHSYKFSDNIRIYSSYLINISHNLSIEPFLIAEKTDYQPFWYNLSTIINYRRTAWIELHYRTGGVCGFGIGTNIMKRILVNYSYEFAAIGLMKASSGTHGITLGILIGKNNERKYQRSYFESNPVKPYSNWVK